MTPPCPSPSRIRAGRRSPAPTSASRQDSRSRTEQPGRTSTTTCGTSPTWPGFRSRWALAVRRLSFAQIADPGWRLVAKELIFAMLVPRHEAVAPLPRAYRAPMHLATASRRLERDRPVPELARRPGHRQPRRDRHSITARPISPTAVTCLERGRHRGRRAQPGHPPLAPPRPSSTCQLRRAVHRRPARPWPAALGRGHRLRDRGDARRPEHEQDAAAQRQTSCSPCSPRPSTLSPSSARTPSPEPAGQGQRTGSGAAAPPANFASRRGRPSPTITRLLDRYRHDSEPLPCSPATWSANGSPPDGSPATRCSRSA